MCENRLIESRLPSSGAPALLYDPATFSKGRNHGEHRRDWLLEDRRGRSRATSRSSIPTINVMTYGELYDAHQPDRARAARPRAEDRAIRSPPCCPTASNRWRSRSPRSRAASTTRRSTGISSAPRSRYIVNDSETKAFIVSDRFASEAVRVVRRDRTCPRRNRFSVGAVDGFRPFAELDRRPADRTARRSRDRRVHVLHIGHHRPAQGRAPRVAAGRSRHHGRRTRAACSCCSTAVRTRTTCTSRRRRCITPRSTTGRRRRCRSATRSC